MLDGEKLSVDGEKRKRRRSGKRLGRGVASFCCRREGKQLRQNQHNWSPSTVVATTDNCFMAKLTLYL
jgi:hypothetical protein